MVAGGAATVVTVVVCIPSGCCGCDFTSFEDGAA